MTNKPLLLIVDECQENVAVQSEFLTQNGFEVLTAIDVESALSQLKHRQPALTVLNLDTPAMKGLDLLQEKKSMGDQTPVIVMADPDLIDELGAFVLRSGAVCYINKTAHLDFLAAQIYSIIALQKEPEKMSMLIAGPLRIDRLAHQVFFREKEIKLQPLQFELLTFLMINARQRFTRPHLLEAVWNNKCIEEKAVTKCVSGIRAKLPEIRDLIRCTAGGYIFEDQVQRV